MSTNRQTQPRERQRKLLAALCPALDPNDIDWEIECIFNPRRGQVQAQADLAALDGQAAASARKIAKAAETIVRELRLGKPADDRSAALFRAFRTDWLAKEKQRAWDAGHHLDWVKAASSYEQLLIDLLASLSPPFLIPPRAPGRPPSRRSQLIEKVAIHAINAGVTPEPRAQGNLALIVGEALSAARLVSDKHDVRTELERALKRIAVMRAQSDSFGLGDD